MRIGLFLGSQGPLRPADSGEAEPCQYCPPKEPDSWQVPQFCANGAGDLGSQKQPLGAAFVTLISQTPQQGNRQRSTHPKVSFGISFSKKLTTGWCLLSDTMEARRPNSTGVTARTPIPSGRTAPGRGGGSWVLGPASVPAIELLPPPGDRLALPSLPCSWVPSTVPGDGFIWPQALLDPGHGQVRAAGV